MNILAIESSCDETSASVISNYEVKSNVISSQYFHKKFGGVIPELASRAHLQAVSQVVRESLENASTQMSDIDALAVTTEPGLIGSLIVGSNFCKGLAVKYNLPVIPINHIEGHLFSGCIQDSSLEFPFIALVVSGGHTVLFYVKSFSDYEIIGTTRDDAAGEAFDKIATLLGMQYPGGPYIDKYAKLGNPDKYDFPRSMINSDDYDFSFSGLKTSVRYFVSENFPNGINEEDRADICASVQAAITDVLVKKAVKAALRYKGKAVIIAGGVSANSGLRAKMKTSCDKHNLKFVAPAMGYCMDNAAMIAFIAQKKLEESGIEHFHNLTFKVSARSLKKRYLAQKKALNSTKKDGNA